VQNPVPRLVTVLRDSSSVGLLLPDTDVRYDDILQGVTSSSGLCVDAVDESRSTFYWIDDVTGALTADNYTSRVSELGRTI